MGSNPSPARRSVPLPQGDVDSEPIRMRRALLCVFEGIDGSGKSTLLGGVADSLKALGLNIFITKQPSGGVTGLAVRRQAKSAAPRSKLAHTLLQHRRAQYYQELLPALRQYDLVLCDR